MGNTCKSYESEYEIQSGTGVYSFKRAVIFIIIFYLRVQHLPKTTEQSLYYGKAKNYDDEIKRRVERKNSLSGITDKNGPLASYRNGNVEVYIPVE